MAADTGATDQVLDTHSSQSTEVVRALLQTLVDSSPDWMLAKDLEHRFLFVNRAFAAAQGLTPDDMVGHCDTEFFGVDQCEPNHTTGHRGFHADDRRAFAGETVHNPHDEATVADGQVRIFDTVKSPLRTPDGRIIGVLSYSRDVTEPRKTDHALRESEEHLRAIVEGEPECVKLLDRDGNLVDMNAAGLRMIQAATLDEVKGRCLRPLVAPEDEPAFREMVASAFRGEASILVFDIVGLKGLRRTLETHSVPLWADPQHTTVKALLGVTRDITERMAGEEALRRSQAQLVEAQRIAAIGSWQWSLDSGELSWSEGAYRVLELDPRTNEVTYESFLSRVHPDDRDLVNRTYNTSVEQRVPYDLVHRLLMPDGRVKFVHERGETRYADGRPTVSLGTVQDITERRQAEQIRLALEAQLRQAQKLEALGTLVGGIAHDFNNILTAILGHAELLASELPAGSTMRAGVDSILDASHRARDLVQRTLTFSRRREHERKVITLQPVVLEALQMLRPSLPTSIEIRSAVTDEQACVLADATQVHQGVMNLCTNAAHAMRDTGGVLSLTYDIVQVDDTDARRHPGLAAGRYARLTVADTGHGMDAATVDRIFDPFFTTKAPGEGTGLGLAVTHGIMQAHDGQVLVSSEPGVGTSFSLYFPVTGEAAPEPLDEHREIPRGRGEHILVVDDEPVLVSLALRMLTQLGYRATGHTRPAEALEEFRRDSGSFDLVMSDLTMPQMSGIELAAQLRRERPDIPVVLTSGYGGALGQEELRRAGVRELLGKPFTLRTMAEVAQRNLRQWPGEGDHLSEPSGDHRTSGPL